MAKHVAETRKPFRIHADHPIRQYDTFIPLALFILGMVFVVGQL